MKRISTFWFLLAAGILYASAQTYTTEHFVITYDIDKVPSRKDKSYLPPGVNPAQLPEFGDPDWEDDPENPGQKRRTIPYYILDMGEHLEKSLSNYVSMGLIREVDLMERNQGTDFNANATGDEPVVNRKLKVKVMAINDANGTPIDGETSLLTGTIILNENVPTSQEEPNKYLVLRKVCAHELLHYITTYHYNPLVAKLSAYAGDYSQQWWWECLAVQADRLVFPEQKPFEAELYAMDKSAASLYSNVMRSWDDCNSDPAWYVSGGFLTYLMYYREGEKATFSNLFFAPIRNFNNDLSFVRTSLDRYVKENLASKGLGDEYQHYLNWLLRVENKDFCIPTGSNSRVYMTNVLLKNDNFQAQTNYELEVPYMSMRVYRFLQGSVSNESRYTLVAPARSLEEITAESVNDVMSGHNRPLPCNLFAYECTDGSRKLLKQLYPGDSLHVFYEKGKWIEVTMINPSIESKGAGKIMLLRYPSLAGTYKGKILFSGTNPKLDEMYTISLSDFQMDIDAKGEAVLGFEFHKSYRKDGYYAKAEKIEGKVDKTGMFTIVGPVTAFTYPKGCTNCCDFPQVKDDPKCMKMPANPYYWKFDGQIVQDKQGWMLKGDIAAGLRPDKFMKASEKLYKFEARRTD